VNCSLARELKGGTLRHLAPLAAAIVADAVDCAVTPFGRHGGKDRAEGSVLESHPALKIFSNFGGEKRYSSVEPEHPPHGPRPPYPANPTFTGVLPIAGEGNGTAFVRGGAELERVGVEYAGGHLFGEPGVGAYARKQVLERRWEEASLRRGPFGELPEALDAGRRQRGEPRGAADVGLRICGERGGALYAGRQVSGEAGRTRHGVQTARNTAETRDRRSARKLGYSNWPATRLCRDADNERLRMKKPIADLEKSDPGSNPNDDGGGGAFGAQVGAIGGAAIGGIGGFLRGGPEGAVFGAGIGAIAGGLAGYFIGNAYGRWKVGRRRGDDGDDDP